MTIEALKRELKYSLAAWRLFREQNEAQKKWGKTPDRSEEEKYLRKSKILILRIKLRQENYEFLNN